MKKCPECGFNLKAWEKKEIGREQGKRQIAKEEFDNWYKNSSEGEEDQKKGIAIRYLAFILASLFTYAGFGGSQILFDLWKQGAENNHFILFMVVSFLVVFLAFGTFLGHISVITSRSNRRQKRLTKFLTDRGISEH